MNVYHVIEVAVIAAAVLAAAGYVASRLRAAARVSHDGSRGCASGCGGCAGCPPARMQTVRLAARAAAQPRPRGNGRLSSGQ